MKTASLSILREAEPEPMVDRQEFLNAMRTVGNSVSVVTSGGQAGRHGGTVSSFCSVSADPAMMLVCLNKTSKIAQVVKGNGVFNINVLPQGAEQISNRFAGASDKELADNPSGRFADMPIYENECGPAIENATVLSCSVDEVIVSGSHIIVTGIVVSVKSSGRSPLAYLDGQYHHLLPVD